MLRPNGYKITGRRQIGQESRKEQHALPVTGHFWGGLGRSSFRGYNLKAHGSFGWFKGHIFHVYTACKKPPALRVNWLPTASLELSHSAKPSLTSTISNTKLCTFFPCQTLTLLSSPLDSSDPTLTISHTRIHFHCLPVLKSPSLKNKFLLKLSTLPNLHKS